MDTADPNDLLQQMVQAGLYGQNLRPLQERYQLGQQFMQTPMAQGANVGGTYKAASPIEHLSNAIRQIVGAKMAGGALQGERDLTSQVGAGRQAYGRALQTAGGQPGPGVPEMLARPMDPQALQGLIMQGAMSGDPGMQHAAQTAMQGRHLDIQTQQMADMMRHRQILEGQGQQKIGLTATEQGHATDAYGNPVMYQKHALPGAVGAAGGGGAPRGMGMTPEALDNAAHLFAQTGVMPPLRGKAAAGLSVQIQNRAAELHPELNLAGNKAGYKADTGSLASQQKILDNAEGWERTGKANLNVLLGIARKLRDTGSPWLNKPVRTFMDKGVGDPNQAAFRAAHATVVNEYAKILSGAQGSGAVTEGARHEAESMLPLDATWEQLDAAARVLDTDAGNRIGAARQQVAQIKGRVSGKPGAEAASPTPTPDTASLRKKYGL